MTDTEKLNEIFDSNKQRYVDEFCRFLEFASISVLPENNDDCTSCAEWLAEHISNIGFEARLLDTGTKPIVYAERAGKPGKPVVLFYGHYDVQPVDPVDEWVSPPFTPAIRNDRIYARGAEDNKGQVLFVLKAMEALIAEDRLDVTVKILIEGEEESGSGGINRMLPELSEMIKADVLMVSDTSCIGIDSPTVIMGLRGIVQTAIKLHGPDHDLHSGVHGGVAPNPAQGIAELVASLHEKDGRIAVRGYYDSITPPSDEERRLANAVELDPESYRKVTGVLPVAGEKDFSPAERTGFRPTIDINGITSGYSGAGMKTVIPSTAEARITSRIVAGQDPQEALDLIMRHLEDNVPAGFRLEVLGKGVGGPGFRLDPSSALVRRARKVLSEQAEKDVVFLWEGASIPVVSGLAEVSGAEPLLVGFGLPEDNIHAPNESFSISQINRGFLYAYRMLEELSAERVD